MPLRYEILTGPSIKVSQSFDSPTVYLDHWAIRRLSDDAELQERFVLAMKRRGGTLLMTHMNFSEFAGSESPNHGLAAGQMLDRLLPSIYFAELNLDRIVAIEEASNNDCRLPPPGDTEMLDMAANATLGLKPFSIEALLAQIYEGRRRVDSVARKTNESIAAQVLTQRQDPEFVGKARKTVPSLKSAKTRLLMRELLRSTVLDPSDQFTPNDAADLQHAILATGYCDYVLLDGKWVDRIRRTRNRLERFGVELRLAQCFSERRSGLTHFLSELERG